jgi:hypothetical protein
MSKPTVEEILARQEEYAARFEAYSPSIQRVYQRDLLGLDVDGRPCEACGRHMHTHEWADMDPWGYVVHCSIAEMVSSWENEGGHV